MSKKRDDQQLPLPFPQEGKDPHVPEGWVLTNLGTVVQPSKERVDPSENPNIAYLSLEHIESETTQIIGHGLGSEVKSIKSVFRAGDVLYGKLRPYLNKVAIPDLDGICSTDILVFSQTSWLDNHYLLRFLSKSDVVQFANQHTKHQSPSHQLQEARRTAFSTSTSR